jgi:hypothetical protein
MGSMKLELLFKRALYRELRSSIGYYDARRIIRYIEEKSGELANVDDIGRILNEAGFDKRQVVFTSEIAKRDSFLLKNEPSRT